MRFAGGALRGGVMAISLQRQADRVELQLMGERARLETVSRNPRWPETDLSMKRRAIAELEATLATMRWLQANEAAVKATARAAA